MALFRQKKTEHLQIDSLLVHKERRVVKMNNFIILGSTGYCVVVQALSLWLKLTGAYTVQWGCQVVYELNISKTSCCVYILTILGHAGDSHWRWAKCSELICLGDLIWTYLVCHHLWQYFPRMTDVWQATSPYCPVALLSCGQKLCPYSALSRPGWHTADTRFYQYL